jgi:hypothetical protein
LAGTLLGLTSTEQKDATAGGTGGLPNFTSASAAKTVLPSVTSVAW